MDDMNLTSVPGIICAEPDNTLTWYGILFVDGSVTVKRYFSYGDLQEAQSSDFVKHCTRLFSAKDRACAMAEGIRLIKAYVG